MAPSRRDVAIELNLRKWRRRPDLFITQFLGLKLTKKQAEICLAVAEHKRVIVRASHGIGKSYIAACLATWFYVCFNDSITITTAPTFRQVTTVVWKEIRKIAGKIPNNGLYPKAPKMERSSGWYAQGLTAAKGDSFQGLHNKYIFLIFDEAVGVQKQFYDAAEGMMTGEEAYQLLICNPTDPSSTVRDLELSGDYHIIQVSSLEHPNIKLELRGEKAIVPGAVSLAWVRKALRNWCSKVPEDQVKPTDIEFPPGSGDWYRPGPLFESRALGRWPTQTTNNVWSDGLFQACLEPQELDLNEPLEVGCDVARFGDDFTVIVARRGKCVLEIYSYNGRDTDETRGHIIEMLRRHVQEYEGIQAVPIKIDDDGVGGGVVDGLKALGFNAIRISAASKAVESEYYENRRSELWFSVSDRAEEFELDLSRIDKENLAKLEEDLLKCRYRLNGRGQRVVEPKEQLKKPDRLGRSPDWADGLHLAFAPENENASIQAEDLVFS